VFIAMALVLIAGCSRQPAPVERVEGAGSPEQAVREVLAALAAADLDRAVDLTAEDQMVAVALVEEASLEEVGAALDGAERSVATNFWSGFAEGLDGLVGVTPEQVEVGEVEQFEAGGFEFARVEVALPGDATPRRFVVREGDGWKVDVIATFVGTLAPGISRQVEGLRGSPEAEVVLEALAGQRASLEAALADPVLDPGLGRQIEAALDALGR
jgi:hypothetical protein